MTDLLAMDWPDVMAYYYEASRIERAKAEFAAKIAGAALKTRGP